MSDTELTETQFNDILSTMWMAGISVEGMTFDVYPTNWELIKAWADSGSDLSSNTAYYHSDFGTVYFKKVK